MAHDASVQCFFDRYLTAMGPIEKALAINRDGKQYGTFAEIGAGQEVARYFFQAGLASHTIAKTMSAYDMIFSDAIYGKEKTGRYVCEPRVLKMLEKEFDLLIERLDEKRGAETCFFAFADTIATNSGPAKSNHGWLGVRYQTEPKGKSNDVILHVRMLDQARLNQQEALGTLGVNLIYTSMYKYQVVSEFVSSLTDAIKRGRIEIDMMRTTGPAFEKMNQYELNLELLRQGLTPAVLFVEGGKSAQPSEMFFKRPLIVKRLSIDACKGFTAEREWSKVGQDQFQKLCKSAYADHLRLIEISMGTKDLPSSAYTDLIPVVQELVAKGQNVLISHFDRWLDLKSFLRRHSNQFIALHVPWNDIYKVFNADSYKDFEGGMVEGLGKLIGEENCAILIDNILTQDREIDFSASHRSLYNYFRDNKKLLNLY